METHAPHPFIRILGVLSYFMTILYLVDHFFQSEILHFTYSVLGAFLLSCSFLFIPNKNRFIVLALVIIGSICLFIEKVPLSVAIMGFGENTNLLSLFLLIPLIGTFMSTSGYLSALKEKVQEREEKGGQHPYRLSFFLTSTIGVLLNYGSMAIVKRISEESFSSYRDKKITLNIMRGFGFCMLWSPYFVNVGLILVLFNLSWFDIGGYGLLLGGIYLIVSWLAFNKISFSNDPIIEQTDKKDRDSYHQSLVPFFIFSLVLISLSFLLDYLLEVNMITIVSLLALVLPVIWAIFTKVIRSYIHDVSEQVQYSFIRLKNELAVFVSAGFFGMALSQTDIGLYISGILFDLSFGSVFLLSIFIVGLSIILAQIGVHPVIIIIGIGSSLSPEKFGVSPEYMAIILLIAWTTATQMSPFSGQVLMASRLMDQPPSAIIKQNITFSLILAGLLTTTTYLFLIFGWI